MTSFAHARARKPFEKARGYSLIEVIVGCAVLAIAALAFAQVNALAIKKWSAPTARVGVDSFRRSLISLITTNSSWQYTVQNNPAMRVCVQTGAGCPTNFASARTFAIYDGANRLFYDGTNPNNGVTTHSVPCGPARPAPFNHSFNYANPAPECPLRYDLKWYALTSTPKPTIAIVATLIVGRDSGLVINPSLYSISPCLNFQQTGGSPVCTQIASPFLRTSP